MTLRIRDRSCERTGAELGRDGRIEPLPCAALYALTASGATWANYNTSVAAERAVSGVLGPRYLCRLL